MTQHFIDRFIAIAAQYPHHGAIEEARGVTTYDLLLRRAAAIGHDLMAQNLPAESVIGIGIEKSADYVAAVLGVWYAGLAFAPLPPALPAARRDYIVRDAGIDIVLTAESLPQPWTQDILPAPRALQAQTLAYVMHTSGSTGTPKGVAVEHRGLCGMLDAQIAAFDLTAQSRSLFYLSINFDASLSDIGTALLSGATLVIADDDTLKDGEKLTKFLRRSRITHCDMPPALLRILPPEDMPDCLRCIIIGGEACPPEAVRRWAARMKVVNVYGPTEATICSSLNPCDPGTWQRPLIGQPLPGVTYRVIDDELYIGGDQVARGYLNLPDLTAQKFITIDGLRYYRTGDRVRLLADGEYAFLGRIDRQFKLRGQLVEPDEIEACLQACGGLRKAAVVKTPEPAQLIAYVTADRAIDAESLLRQITPQLPKWMIPAQIIQLQDFPQTATGKTDYAALSALRAPSLHASDMPETAQEKAHWQLWRGVLGHDDFGIRQSFYSAGGDSLGIIRLTLDAARSGIDAHPAAVAEGQSIHDILRLHSAQEAPFKTGDSLRGIARAALPDAARIERAKNRPAPKDKKGDILLTGATGCLGSRILHGLLLSTRENIFCLVRAENSASGFTRIRAAFDKYGLSLDPADAARLTVVTGDAAKNLFGLDAETYAHMAVRVARIYHCAASVNMLADFDTLAPANFDAVRHILDFALEGRKKEIHAASTLSVFVSTDQNRGALYETDRLDHVARIYGGYAQTKFAAERLLLEMPEEACPVWHYRFGLLTGDTQSGAAPERDFLAMFGRGLAALGVMPEGFDDHLHVDITPVDYAARAMLHLAQAAPAGIYHIANPAPLSLGQFAAAMTRAGRAPARIPFAAWQDMLKTRPMDTAESAAALGLCRALGEDGYRQHRIMDLFQATSVTFDTTTADRYLHPAGIRCPAASDGLMDLYMRSIFPPAPAPLRICLFGPESTGKSTLAEKLAAHYGTAFCAEYAKDYIAARAGQITAGDIPAIAAGQRRAEQTAAASTPALLICDTDLLTTCIWSEWLFSGCPAWTAALAAETRYDLYLLMDIDTPWVEDIHRYLPDNRADFLALCRQTLENNARPYKMLSGTWDQKFADACAAINNLIQPPAREEAA